MSETTIYNITRKFTNTEIDMADVESANVAFQSEFTGIQATPKYSVAKNGTDVVATLPGVTYYATVDINEDFIADGHLEQVANGVWNSSNPKNYSLGYGKQSIIDALESGTWNNGDDTVDIAGYKALEDKTGWVFQGGTLKLTIETHKSHHASYDSYYFTTKTLYNLEAALTETDTPGIEHHEFTDVHMLLDVADLTAVNNGTYTGANWYGAAWEAAQTNYGSNLALSNLHIWEVIGETETDITTQYLAEAAAHTGFDTESDYNDALAGAANDQTLTFANFVDNNNLSVNDSKYLVDLTKEGATSYAGTIMNEKVTANGEKETFNMGRGQDKITFKGKFGDDVVKLSGKDNDELVLEFADDAAVTAKPVGNDLVITDNTLEYYATVKVDCDYVFEAGNESEQNPEGKTSIVDYLQSGTWKNGSKTVNLEQYKALTEAQKAEYTFQGGTLRFSIMDWAGDGSAYYFGTRLNDTAVEGNPLRFGADKNDLAHMYAGTFSGENGFYQNCYAAFQWRCSQTEWAKDINMSDLHIYKLENGTATDITEAYLAETSTYDIETMYNEQDFSGGTVTIKDFSNAARTADDIRINGTAEALYRRNYNGTIVYTDPQVAKLFTTTDADVKGGKITIKGNTNNTVDVSNYSSDSAKGVKITTGKGNDYITGSMYNDTITSKGGYNNVVEMGGTNKITLGNGGSTVTVTGYSSNTIKAKGGDNYLDIDSLGANKVTLGKGDDTVWLQDGVNTVNVGAGENRIWAVDGNNKVTGGKNKDVLTVNAGQTTAKLGAGNDIADINGGNVVLDMGAGNDNVYFDNYGIVGVGDIIASVNGGKGNDLYDLSQVTFTKHDEDAGTFANRIAITDKKGTNTIVLDDNDTPGFADDYDVYFNVSIKTKKGKITKTTVGKSIIINKDDDIANKDTGVVYNYDGKLTKQGVTKNLLVTADAETAGKGLNISQIASTVATWLNANGYQSADAVMYGSDDTARAQLAGIYQGADTVYMKDGVTAFAGYTAANVFQDPVNM